MCRALRRVPFFLDVVAAATSFVRGRLISRRARHQRAAALLLLCCIAGRPLVFKWGLPQELPDYLVMQEARSN